MRTVPRRPIVAAAALAVAAVAPSFVRAADPFTFAAYDVGVDNTRPYFLTNNGWMYARAATGGHAIGDVDGWAVMLADYTHKGERIVRLTIEVEPYGDRMVADLTPTDWDRLRGAL